MDYGLNAKGYGLKWSRGRIRRNGDAPRRYGAVTARPAR